MREHVVEDVLKAFAAPFLPARAQFFGVAFEAALPMGVELGWDDGCVVSSVLKECAIVVQQGCQMAALVSLVARKERHVVSALDG